MTKRKSPPPLWLLGMPEKDIFELGQAVSMFWTTENWFVLRNSMYHYQNGLTIFKASTATVIVALAIWEKARICAHFAQHMESGVCKIPMLYDSYSLLKKTIYLNELTFYRFK